MMKSRLGLFFLAVLLSTCACGNKEHDLPPVDPVPFTRYNSGLSISSTLLNREVKYDILLPEGYDTDTDKRYPVMYCFHGYGDNNTSWNGKYMACEPKIKNLEKQGLEPIIYVFPNGWNTYWVDRFNGKYPYMSMLVQEFIPFIDKTYRTIADREHRGTIGYSMGGFGAMVIAMKHPELFSMSAPLSMSFRTDEQYMAESQSGWDNQWGGVFGGVGQSGEGRLTDYYKEHCPLHQFTAENKDKYSSVHWFLTCGDNEEQLLIANDDLHVMMRDNGYEHEYRVGDGGHSTSYWKAALDEILPYFSALMAGETSWQKTYKTPDLSNSITLNEDGVFTSTGYISVGKAEGTALYVVHHGLDAGTIKDIFSILQRGISTKKFVLLPCDLEKKNLNEWISFYKDIYPSTAMQALAIGKAGTAVFKAKTLFSALYFENAEINENITVDTERFWYIGQTDEGSNYTSANALYKACKLGKATFEYRCRNHIDDSRTDLLIGIEYMKSILHNL